MIIKLMKLVKAGIKVSRLLTQCTVSNFLHNPKRYNSFFEKDAKKASFEEIKKYAMQYKDESEKSAKSPLERICLNIEEARLREVLGERTLEAAAYSRAIELIKTEIKGGNPALCLLRLKSEALVNRAKALRANRKSEAAGSACGLAVIERKETTMPWTVPAEPKKDPGALSSEISIETKAEEKMRMLVTEFINIFASLEKMQIASEVRTKAFEAAEAVHGAIDKCAGTEQTFSDLNRAIEGLGKAIGMWHDRHMGSRYFNNDAIIKKRRLEKIKAECASLAHQVNNAAELPFVEVAPKLSETAKLMDKFLEKVD